MLSNVTSLVPKIGELAQVLKNHNPDMVFIKLFPQYRKEKGHGGVCLYINSTYDVTVLDEKRVFKIIIAVFTICLMLITQ